MARLYFYYSAMNAGKTTTLLQSSYNYHERGMDTLLFTPLIDDHFATGKIASRIGLVKDAIPFDRAFHFLAYIEKIQQTLPKLKCILINESHIYDQRPNHAINSSG